MAKNRKQKWHLNTGRNADHDDHDYNNSIMDNYRSEDKQLHLAGVREMTLNAFDARSENLTNGLLQHV